MNSLAKSRMVKIKVSNNRIYIENKDKKFFGENIEEYNNYAVFQVLNKEYMRYFPFKDFEYLGYDKDLPLVNEEKDLILKTPDAMDLLNKMLSSGQWSIWSEDLESIGKMLEDKE